LTIGKQSGRNAVKHKIMEYSGVVPSDEVVGAVLLRVKALYGAGRRRSLGEEEFAAILRDVGGGVVAGVAFPALNVKVHEQK
jgi:isopropylmalate/homocitrate/citramalate synthase